MAMLSHTSTPTLVCAGTAQAVNSSLGFVIYKKYVFKPRKRNQSLMLYKYSAMSLCLLSLNWLITDTLSALNVNRLISGAVAVTLTGIFSFYSQDKWVYKAIESDTSKCKLLPQTKCIQ